MLIGDGGGGGRIVSELCQTFFVRECNEDVHIG